MGDQNFGNSAETGNCPIWPGFQAIRRHSADSELYIDSPRAGGPYFISPDAVAELEATFTLRLRNDPQPGPPRFRVSEFNRLRLTTWLIDQWSSTGMEPLVTPEVIASLRYRRRLLPHERASRLLHFIAQESPSIGEPVMFQLREHLSRRHEANLMAFAWSESDSLEEMEFLVSYLGQNGWLHSTKDAPGYRLACTVTVEGYTEIARQPPPTESNQAFVAMWFHDSMEEAYWHGIAPAVRAAGYEPVRIDALNTQV